MRRPCARVSTATVARDDSRVVVGRRERLVVIEKGSQAVETSERLRDARDECGLRTFVVWNGNVVALRERPGDVEADRGLEEVGRVASAAVLEGVRDLAVRRGRVDGSCMVLKSAVPRTKLNRKDLPRKSRIFGGETGSAGEKSVAAVASDSFVALVVL